MAARWYLELVAVAEGDRVYSHALGERLWLADGGRVVMGRTPAVDVHCLGRGQGGRRALTIELRGEQLRLQHAGHDLPVWHRGRPTHGDVELGVGDHVGPSYGITFVVGRADPGPLPGAHRVGPAIAFAPRGTGGAPRVSSGFRIDDPERALVDVLTWHGEIGPDSRARMEARMSDPVAHASAPRLLEAGLGPHGAWALRECTLGVAVPLLWERTKEQRASLDVDAAGFLVETLGRGVLAGAIDWGLSSAGAVVRFADGQPLLLVRPVGAQSSANASAAQFSAEASAAQLLPRLDEEDAASLVLECAALLARSLQPGRAFPSFAWTPPAQARADVRSALASISELSDDVRALAIASASDDPAARPEAHVLLDALARARTTSAIEIRAHLRDVVAHLFPAELAAAEDMLEAVGTLDIDTLRA